MLIRPASTEVGGVGGSKLAGIMQGVLIRATLEKIPPNKHGAYNRYRVI